MMASTHLSKAYADRDLNEKPMNYSGCYMSSKHAPQSKWKKASLYH